jgi:hypothetical protein
MKCSERICRNEAEYYVVTGCLKEMHVASFKVCLSHMVQLRAAYMDTTGNHLHCVECRHAGMNILVDEMMIKKMDGTWVTNGNGERV